MHERINPALTLVYAKYLVAAIESITVGEPTIEAIYNLEGKRMNNMSRGLNILRMSDGTTKKVLNLREK